jgi:MSHA type pilus biogenesis protein MshL
VSNLWGEIEGRDKDGKLDDKVKTGIRALLSEKGSLAVNKMASALMVTDFSKNLEVIEKFLQQVERAVSRQVIIEAQILEVTLNDRFQLGIDWRFLPQMTNAGFGWTSNQNLTGTTSTIPPSWGVPAATTGLTAGVATLNFVSMLDALAQQGHVNVISTPRVSTLNNQKSIIKAAVEEVYFEITISTSTGGPPIITATPRNVTIGVILNVTPQIDADGNILLDIQPSVTEEITRRTQVVGATSSGQPILTEAPVVSVRQAQTVARVRDGQTIVIAGLIRERKRNLDTGVPGLMEIPLLGYLFRTTAEIKEKSELVILITPKLYGESQILDFTRQDLERSRDFQKKKRLDERVFCPTCPE